MPAVRKPAVHKKLATYRKKRDFALTSEPSGQESPRIGHSFVVQKHAARRLHYDFRLELDGVLLSWAVPKGPSLDPTQRRLAVRTEDHPLSYRDFEGVIPAGQYGGGAVIVWDRGSWEPEGDPHDGLAKGRLTFTLAGEKLRGRFHLVKTGKGDTGEKSSWLLFKSKDTEVSKDELVETRPESVISGRTIDAVRSAPARIWQSNRGRDLVTSLSPARAKEVAQLAGQLPTKVKLTNLDKVLYADCGVTKGALVAYYATVQERILPLIAGRPLSLFRCPNGPGKAMEGNGPRKGTGCFFQKHHSAGVPKTVGTVKVREESGEVATHMRIDDFDGLIGLVQLGVLEIHTWGCHADTLEEPDLFVMDFDPDPTVGWPEVVRGAREMKAMLDELGLESFVKTTGGKGLHVVVPVVPELGWDDFKDFTHALAGAMVQAHPDRYTINPLKAQRKGKIFIDYLRNGRGATAIAPYSTRARDNATVSVPVAWDQLDSLDPRSLTVLSLPTFLGAQPRDPWAGFNEVEQRISKKLKGRMKMGGT